MEFKVNPILYFLVFMVILNVIIIFILTRKNCPRLVSEPNFEDNYHKVKRIISLLSFVIGSIPLCLYPLIMLANCMSLAGDWTGKESELLKIVVHSFVILSSLYPLTYIYNKHIAI